MALSKIRFPVLKELKIENYQLFPGVDRKGLSHSFLPGMTVIAGINGLGKTTLLNMILRGLTGKKEPKKFNPYDPGGGVHEMVEQDVDFFGERVMDKALDATVIAVFMFGDDELCVTRNLGDLTILQLKINGLVKKGEQDELQQFIVEISNAADDYDFFYIVRCFTFFLEDKVSLIWNPRGQFEIFRILFFNSSEAQKFANLQDEVQKIDSDYRNRRFSIMGQT